MSKASEQENKVKYTPGPWKQTLTGFMLYIHTNEEALIATMSGGGRVLHSKATIQANANLIAAAPEMLEALKEERRFLLALQKLTGYPVDPVVERIDAAISKAEGNQ